MKTHYTDQSTLRACMMGPNCLSILEELVSKVVLPEGQRILDLGPGMGLTSMYLADRCKARQVFAADLWIDPTDNYRRFDDLGFGDSIVPLRAEASALPFAKGYFDAMVSIDSWHYFGAGKNFLEEHVLPLVRPGGLLIVGIPGLKKDTEGGRAPEGLEPWWQEDMHFYSAGWWRELWSGVSGLEILFNDELTCHAQAWADWLACDNPYAVGDRDMMRAEGGRWFSTIGMIARVAND